MVLLYLARAGTRADFTTCRVYVWYGKARRQRRPLVSAPREDRAALEGAEAGASRWPAPHFLEWRAICNAPLIAFR